MGLLNHNTQVLKRVLGTCLFFLLVLVNARSERLRTIIDEDFETYTNTAGLRAVWASGTAELATVIPGGGQAAWHDGADLNKQGGFSIRPDALHSILISADLYDFATNANKRLILSLKNQRGEGVELGIIVRTGYSVRASGMGPRTNWVPLLKRGQVQRVGWHRFRATLSATNLTATIDLGADGRIDRLVSFPIIPPTAPLTQFRFGGLAARPSIGGPVLVDNIKLQVIELDPPPPPPVADLSANSQTQAIAGPLTNIAAPVLGSSRAPGAGRSAISMLAVWWIGAGLVFIIGLVIILLLRRGPGAAASHAGATSAVVRVTPESADQWRQRALNAEATASRQARLLNEKVGPELKEFAKQALVQGLCAQRDLLIETQIRAQHALTELENRMAELHLPLQDRIRAYEKRIQELEKELETRDEAMRELTRATLSLVRQRLEHERAQRQPSFN